MSVLDGTSIIRINPSLCVLNITFKCNLGCDNCGSNCSKKQAPSEEMMRLDRIEYFVKDTIDCGKKYKNVALFGGEPTLHPQFDEICLIIKKANDKENFADSLSVCTNGYARESVEHCNFAASHGYIIENSQKDQQIYDKTHKYPYVPVNVAPIDVGFTPDLNGCWYSENAGIAFDERGYWGCYPFCAAARVFDYEPTCMSIKELTEDVAKKSWGQHCNYCGSSFPIAPVYAEPKYAAVPDAIDIVTERPIKRVVNQSMSKIWVEAFKKYKEKMIIKKEENDGY